MTGALGPLEAAPAERVRLPEEMWGFGGVHGGLALALLLRAISASGGQPPLRFATARFHRAARAFRDPVLYRAARTVNAILDHACWRARCAAT